MDPNSGLPTRLTSTTIDERLADIDLDDNVVSFLWDDRAIAVRVYITPKDGSTTLHFVWDVRNEAWWPFKYSNDSHNPLAIHLLSGGNAEYKRILEYGQDGYIRMVDIDSETDDGNAIVSFVYLGPFSNMMFQEIYATLSESSTDVTWAICTASSLERSLTAAPRQTGTFKSGRNPCHWPRSFIENGYLRLSATGPWALESLMVAAESVSETMRRTMRTTP